jgi:hypothetical protein
MELSCKCFTVNPFLLPFLLPPLLTGLGPENYGKMSGTNTAAPDAESQEPNLTWRLIK